jgi:hypothetical protein
LATALLAELGEKGAGREEVVLGLLDQGADVNYCTKVWTCGPAAARK